MITISIRIFRPEYNIELPSRICGRRWGQTTRRYNRCMPNSILDLPFVGETRRNHALEHATLHVLAAKHPGRMLAGHSNPTGFFILGDVRTEDVTAAAEEALRRLRLGERELAIHPGCGTNFATSALLAGTLAWLVLRGGRSPWGRMLRLPFAIAFALVGLALSRPLGPIIQQKITTDADVGTLQLVEVKASAQGRLTAHRVITR
jgi:hypothetical protein